MSRDYFSQYPKTTFRKENKSIVLPSGKFATYDVEVTDILLKFKIRDLFLSDASLFYPYRWKDGDRPDSLADKYYGSHTFHWVVFYSNGSFDYNYDFAMEQSVFDRFLLKKYDMTAIDDGIARGILIDEPDPLLIGTHLNKYVLNDGKFYRVDNSGIREIGKSSYIFSYLEEAIKYWQTGDGIIIGETEFNILSPSAGTKVQTITIEDSPAQPISIGTGVSQASSSATGIVLDYDSVNRVVTVGEIPLGSSFEAEFNILLGGSITVKPLTVFDVTPDPEARPVSFFAYEIEANEEKRNVQLLDNDYFMNLVKQFRREMSLINAQRS